MPAVSKLNVTPVKGTSLHHPNEVRVESIGVPGNRLFFVVDEEGKRITATRLAPLVEVGADYDGAGERLSLSFPDGTTVEGDARAGPEALLTDFWGRDVDAHLVDHAFTAPLSRYLGRAASLARCDREGDGNDVRALTFVSEESVAELARRGGHDGPLDPARFRMTFEIEGCSPHGEDEWSGRTLQVGETRIHVNEPVPRCLVTTWSPRTGEKDFETLKVIAGYRNRTEGGLPFGVYATVEQPGTIRVGDAITLVGA